jgi:3-deoxy-D-arabino-heptulosonate 7-phosphate (DAHP) synthase class II
LLLPSNQLGQVDQRATLIKAAVAQLEALPPLVFAGECDDLKARIALAAEGKAFWLQGGDCAETFAAATADSIRNRIKTILQMAAVLQYYSSLAGYQGWSYGGAVCKASFQ